MKGDILFFQLFKQFNFKLTKLVQDPSGVLPGMSPSIIYDHVGLGRGFSGGVCIGLVSTSLLYLTGKTLGVSGILGAPVKALRLSSSEPAPYWQLSFLAGMLVSGGVLLAVQPPSAVFGATLGQYWAVPLVGGVLVGFGTRLGQGCTSGHGVSGLPRLSPRSLVNVMSFMGAGALTAGLSRASFSRSSVYTGAASWDLKSLFVVPLAVTVAALFLLQTLTSTSTSSRNSGSGGTAASPSASTSAEPLVSAPSTPTTLTASGASRPSALALFVVFIHGLAFGLALGLSGMCDPAKVLGFLDFFGDWGWDPQLALVMGGAVVVNACTFRYLALSLGGARPPFAAALSGASSSNSGGESQALASGDGPTFAQLIPYGPKAPPNCRITWELVVGGVVFGAGWGLCGVCPGPAIVDFVSGGAHFGVAVPAVLVGMALQEVGQERGLWGGQGKGGAGAGGGSAREQQQNKD